jgi:hypothetical protein
LEKMVYSVEKPKKTHCLWGFWVYFSW